jgi:hypothetical protein
MCSRAARRDRRERKLTLLLGLRACIHNAARNARDEGRVGADALDAKTAVGRDGTRSALSLSQFISHVYQSRCTEGQLCSIGSSYHLKTDTCLRGDTYSTRRQILKALGSCHAQASRKSEGDREKLHDED